MAVKSREEAVPWEEDLLTPALEWDGEMQTTLSEEVLSLDPVSEEDLEESVLELEHPPTPPTVAQQWLQGRVDKKKVIKKCGWIDTADGGREVTMPVVSLDETLDNSVVEELGPRGILRCQMRGMRLRSG